jgi:galactokinase
MTSASRAGRVFAEAFGAPAAVLASAPGRVNLIGEHTDYNEGWVLPVALDMRACVAAGVCSSSVVTLRALDIHEGVSFRLTELAAGIDIAGRPLPGWARYPAGVAQSLQAAGFRLPGLDGVLASDVPMGAGLASSAAVGVAFALAWQALSGFEIDRLALARLCQRSENEYVGVQCGLMDPYAALFGQVGKAILLDTRTAVGEAVPMPADLALVVTDSGVHHALGASAYNSRRQECAEAARRLAAILPGVTSLRDVTPAQLEAVGSTFPPTLLRRAQHVVHECRRVLQAVERMRQGDRPGLGSILKEGHASLRDLFEVSHPAVDTLVELADQSPACFGSRLTGGGFGGSTVSLVDPAQAERFAVDLVERYRTATGQPGKAWVCTVGGPATVENVPNGWDL